MLKVYEFITSKYRIIIPVVWTIALMTFYFAGTSLERGNLIQQAKINASASFEKDIVYRRWNAEHETVYVPVTEKNPPNPFLSDPDKNVTTEGGKKLTLVNPAYMIRQVHELAREAYGIRGRITSLNPIRPQNKPDSWETDALNSFNKGEQEIYSEELIDEKPYLRFMKPLITEKSCLRCHEEQGYKEGDVRGGISISVPLDPYFSIHSERIKFSAWMFVVIWAAGISFFFLGTNRINKLNKIRAEAEKKRREAEERMIQQNYILERAQELGQIGTWEFDISDDRFFWSDENFRILGVPEGSVVDYETFIEKVHPDDREYVYQEWKTALEGKSFNIVHRLLIDDQIKWVREKADVEFDEEEKAARLIGFIQDITTPKQTELALKESEGRYKEFVEGTNDLIIRTDKDIKLIYTNHVSTRVFGLHPQDCVSMSAFDFIHPDDRNYTRDWIEKLKESKKHYGTIENRQVSLKGGVYRMFWNFSFHYDDNGDLMGINGIARDVTEHKQTETQIQQSEKMKGIALLAGGITHDFNKILKPVLLHSELVMDDLASDNPLQHSIKEIYEAGVRARELLRKISTFAGKDSDEKILLKASVIFKSAIDSMRSTIPDTIAIKYGNKAENDIILADPAHLKQIIFSLATNALHAMREKGGLLEILLDNEDITSEKAIRLFNMKPGKYLKISVKDTGSGISQNMLGRIFEPYYTNKQPVEGTGLGLAIIHGIVLSYGGVIKAEPDTRQGTTFHIYLPLSDTENSEADELKKEAARGIERILYVDDDKPSKGAIEMMFERLGYKTTVKASSKDALEIFSDDPKKFDLVIIDVIMPDMTGKELVIKLKTLRSDVPIILSIDYDGQIDGVTAEKIGVDELVIKPIIRDEIAETIRKVLNRNKIE